jgi:hypothetical protein
VNWECLTQEIGRTVVRGINGTMKFKAEKYAQLQSKAALRKYMNDCKLIQPLSCSEISVNYTPFVEYRYKLLIAERLVSAKR